MQTQSESFQGLGLIQQKQERAEANTRMHAMHTNLGVR
jgi:hypothetical protein